MLGFKTTFTQDTSSYTQTWSTDSYQAIGPPAGYAIPAGTYYVFIGFVLNTTNISRFDWGFSPGGVTQNLSNIGNGAISNASKTFTSSSGIVTNTASTNYYIGSAGYYNTTVTIIISYINVYYVRIA